MQCWIRKYKYLRWHWAEVLKAGQRREARIGENSCWLSAGASGRTGTGQPEAATIAGQMMETCPDVRYIFRNVAYTCIEAGGIVPRYRTAEEQKAQ